MDWKKTGLFVLAVIVALYAYDNIVKKYVPTI
jgi:hypothetical protein